MLAVLFGLVAALAFSFVAYSIYGLEGVMTLAWIDQVFWALIIAGALIGLVNAIWSCLGCRLGKLLFSQKLADYLCNDARCN